MTKLGIRPYRAGDTPLPATVPVSVIVLTRNEELNVGRCLTSVAWAQQVVVVDSGSTDATVKLARAYGADVIEQPWLGFAGQREFALRLPVLRHDWVYFVDADQWVSPQLSTEIAACLRDPGCSAFSHRFRLVFQGTWIRHCGWYTGSWNVQLMNRRYARYNGNQFGERVRVEGETRRLRNDIVDDDHKSLADWLHKHVRYAQLEAARRAGQLPIRQRLHALTSRDDIRPFSRILLKDIVFPCVPAKPAALFAYMYLLRLGVLDGAAGLRFCFLHAWFEVVVRALGRDIAGPAEGAQS